MSTEHTGIDPILGTPPAEPPPEQTEDQRSLGDIVGDVAQDLTSLVRQEIELARTELKQEASRAGKGAGLLGGAGLAALLFLVFLSLTITFLLDNWTPLEVAALIVTAVWAVVAAALAARGRRELKRSNPQLPETQQTLKEDAAWARAQKN